MSEFGAKEFENKKRFYHRLFEAFLHFQSVSRQAIAAAQQQVAEREQAGWRKNSSKPVVDTNSNINKQGLVARAQIGLVKPVVAEIFVLELGAGLRHTYSKIAALIDADQTILTAHKSLHKRAVEIALCANNPTELLRKLQQMYEVLCQAMPLATREEREAHIERYLASTGEVNSRGETTKISLANVPELKQQLGCDMHAVLSQPKPMPQRNQIDKMQYDQFSDLLELTLRFNYFQQVVNSLSNPALVSRTTFLMESKYVARTVLVKSNLNTLFNPAGASQLHAEWMRLFAYNSYAQSLRPGLGLGEHHQERQFKFR